MVARRNINRKHLTAGLALLAALMFAAPSQTGSAQAIDLSKCLRLGANSDLGSAYSVYEDVINVIYQRAGLCAVSTAIPPKRQTVLIKSGALDGEWMRFQGYEKGGDSNLVPVPQPIFMMEAVFVRRADSDFSGAPDNLDGKQVAYMNGLRWIETHLPLRGAIGVPVPADVPVKDLLLRGRFDIYATHRLAAETLLEELGDERNMVVVSHWEHVPFLHYLHKRHSDKATELAAAIRAAIEAGDMDPLYALPGINRVERLRRAP